VVTRLKTNKLFLFFKTKPSRVGCIVGLWMTSLMMNVIRGAVNGVIVCFADSPMNFETNQPDSASKLRKAWVSVFPEIGSSGILSQPTYAVVV
jgi:hypothetical protein